jgi:hypothetical protein
LAPDRRGGGKNLRALRTPLYVLPTHDATASGGAVVQKWRGGGRWFTDLCLVSEHDKSTKTLTFDDKIGCNQGGEGEVGGSQWWVENVKEELDDANEWWYVRVKRRSACVVFSFLLN